MKFAFNFVLSLSLLEVWVDFVWCLQDMQVPGL